MFSKSKRRSSIRKLGKGLESIKTIWRSSNIIKSVDTPMRRYNDNNDLPRDGICQ
jgi:hypothetical protein